MENKIFLVDEKFGIYYFDGVSLKLEVPFADQKPIKVSGITEANNTMIVVSQNQGLFTVKDGKLIPWNEKLSSLLSTKLR